MALFCKDYGVAEEKCFQKRGKCQHVDDDQCMWWADLHCNGGISKVPEK